MKMEPRLILMLIVIMVICLYCGQDFNLPSLNTKLQNAENTTQPAAWQCTKEMEAMREQAVPPAPGEFDSGINTIILSF